MFASLCLGKKDLRYFILRYFVYAALFQFALPIAWGHEKIDQRELEEKLRAYQSIRTMDVTFRQVKYLNELGVQIKSEGRLQVKRPSDVTWEVTKPSPVKISFNGERIRIESKAAQSAPDIQEFRLQDAPSEKVGKSIMALMAWLRMDVSVLAKQYEVTQTGKDRFQFVPKEKDTSPFGSIQVRVGDDGHLRSLELFELSGDRLEIQFGKPHLNQ